MALEIQPEARVNDALLMVRAGRKGRALIASREISRGERIVVSPFIELGGPEVERTDGRLGDYIWEDGFAAGAGCFFNHSDEPNVTYQRNDGLIVFKARRRIEAGEEVTINYGYEIPRPLKPIRLSRERLARMLESEPPTIR